MNYACVFLVFILLCSAISWYISGRKYYTGPVVEAAGNDSEGDHSGLSAEIKQDKATLS
jgi:hypothetical protein